jgi:hypothetical protein
MRDGRPAASCCSILLKTTNHEKSSIIFTIRFLLHRPSATHPCSSVVPGQRQFSVSSEKLTVAHLVNILPLYEARSFINVFPSVNNVPQL